MPSIQMHLVTYNKEEDNTLVCFQERGLRILLQDSRKCSKKGIENVVTP
jgi:hypothetical protein